MAASAAQAAALVGAIKANWLVNRASIGCTALLVADYLHTLPDEIKYMWRSQMSPVKLLFFLVRYYPFAHTVISLWHHGDPYLTGEACVIPFTADAISCIVTTWLCDAVSYLRVYAFSGRKRGLLMFLAPWYIIIRVAEFVLVYKFAQTAKFTNLPPAARIGCVAREANTLLLSFVFKLILLSLATATFIMIYIAWRKWEGQRGLNGGTGLFHVFLRDGTMYFICLSTLAIGNIIFDHAAPQNGTQYTMVQIQVHANAILAGRMLIYLRAFAHKDVDTMQESGELKYLPRPSRKQNTTDAPGFSPYNSKTVPQVFVQIRTETASDHREGV